MKKKSINNLSLNKKSISNLETEVVRGKGDSRDHPISKLLGGGSWCVCL
ncbi:hypothetical protein [Kordia sp.]